MSTVTSRDILISDDILEMAVTKAVALTEIRNHGHDPVDFLEDLGDHPEYKGADVLDWLGY